MDLEDKKKNLFPVRCPFERLSRTDGKIYRCNSLCGKAKPGSAGELMCRKCHLTFNYEVDQEGVVQTYVNVLTAPQSS